MARYGRIVISRFGGPEVLDVVEDELRDASEGEVRVKVLAAGVSWVERMMRRGSYPGQPKPPFTPGYDVVGVIDQRGPGASRFAEGERVAALTIHGGYAEYVYLREEELVPVPAGIDPAEAVCLVLNYVTAYQMLHRTAELASGRSALVHSAAGGVGTALLELGRLAGITAYATASAAKHELVTRLGGRAIDYRKEDFVRAVRGLTGGAGVDAVFDAVGGRHWLRSARCLRAGGQLVAYGSQHEVGQSRLAALAEDAGSALLLALWPGRRFRFYAITSMKRDHPDWFREDLTALFALLAQGKIHPVIMERIPWREARRAQEILDQGAIQGKLVLTFPA
jgi:NADPH:quinone reductase-like Zn-dependent oxidoreductase